MEQEMLCLTLLGFAILVVLAPTAVAALQYSLWALGETQKPLRARCWGPGSWPHPSHCRLFSVCQLDRNGSTVGHLFLCPLGSSYSSRKQHCIVNQTVMPECATSLEDNSILDSLLVEQLSSDMPLQLRCGDAQAPYCADNEMLVVCTPSMVLVGAVNCSAQHWTTNTEPLQCDKSSSRCATSSAWLLHQDSAIPTSTQNSSVAFSHNLSSPASAAPNNSLLLHIAPNNLDLNLHLHDNITTTTNSHLQMTLPAMSTEGKYDNEFYTGDDERDYYDMFGSVPDYLDTKCTRKGLQCIDNTTIMDCYENLHEQFFVLSCNSLLYSDEDESVGSYCDDDTSSCILTSNGMTITVSIKRVESEDLEICESHSGLQCVDNDTLITCLGDTTSTHHTLSCNGLATSETNTFLQGHCSNNSCIFVTVNQSNTSDIQANNTKNYDPFHLVSPDTNSTSTVSPYSNKSITYHSLPPYNHSSASQLLYTKINSTYLWPLINANSVKSESPQTNKGVSQLLLPTDDDSAANESLHSNTSVTYYLIPPETNTINESLNVSDHILLPDADSAASESPYNITGTTYHLLPSDNDNFETESLYSHISSVTNTTDIHEEPDIPVKEVEMSDLYEKHEIIKYNLSEAQEEYFIADSKTKVHTANSTSSGNHDLVTYTAEKILQTAQDDSSQMNDYLMAAEKTPSHTAVHNVDFVLLPPPNGNSLEVTSLDDVKFHSETSPLLNPDHISVTSETSMSTKNPASPTQISLSSSGNIVIETNTEFPKIISRETISFVPEIIPKILISKSTPTETAFSVTETVPTKFMTPVPKVILTETFSVLETLPTEITMPVSKSIHTENDFPIPETLLIEITTPTSTPTETEAAFFAHETVTPISKSIHTENDFFVPEAGYTEITTSVSKLMTTETLFTATETESVMLFLKPIHNETALSVLKTVSTEVTTPVSNVTLIGTDSPVPQTIPTKVIMPASELLLTDTDISVHENIPTQAITPVSQLIPTQTASLLHETITTQATAPVSESIPVETASLVPETIPTESTTSISKPIHRKTASSIPETIPGDMVNFNSGTTVTLSQPTMLVTEDKIMVSKLIPVTGTLEAGGSSITDLHSHLQAINSVSAIQSASEIVTSKSSAHVSEFMSTKSTRITATAEMDQPEHLETALIPAISKTLEEEESDILQNVCQKAGIQCIDSLTLGACLPDLTLSYTVSCQMLLPYVMSEHHDVYCNKKSDTCAMEPWF